MGPSHRLAPFLPYINSKQLLKAILDVGAQEKCELDAEEPSGNHRREALIGTCLDCRLMAQRINVGWNDAFQRQSTDVRTPSESLGGARRQLVDPHVTLCPYEISGVCVDPYCSYQHLGNRPLGCVLPREFLPLPSLQSFMILALQQLQAHVIIELNKVT